MNVPSAIENTITRLARGVTDECGQRHLRCLDDMFKDAKGYANQKNARAKLNKFKDAIGNALTVTLPRADGRWIAVVIYQDKDRLNIPALIHNGICVVN